MNASKKKDPRFQRRWLASGAIQVFTLAFSITCEEAATLLQSRELEKEIICLMRIPELGDHLEANVYRGKKFLLEITNIAPATQHEHGNARLITLRFIRRIHLPKK